MSATLTRGASAWDSTKPVVRNSSSQELEGRGANRWVLCVRKLALLGSFYPHTWRRKVRPRVVRPRGVMVWLEGGNLHLPEHPTEPQVESARLAAIHLGWIRELMRRNVQNLSAAGRTAPSHINAQPFLRGDTPRIVRRTIFVVSPNRWIVSPIRVKWSTNGSSYCSRRVSVHPRHQTCEGTGERVCGVERWSGADYLRGLRLAGIPVLMGSVSVT